MADIERIDPELETLKLNKKSGYNYRKRRQDDWLENYTLSRDKVTINRLTQRQSVNLPLMKMVIKTIIKDVDDLPVLYFENLDNDKQAELFKNEYWKLTGEDNKFELQDIIDKMDKALVIRFSSGNEILLKSWLFGLQQHVIPNKTRITAGSHPHF